MQKFRSNVTYANVVATLALVLAIGTGGAFAASKLVSGSKIKPHTITSKQIKNGSLTGPIFGGNQSLPDATLGSTNIQTSSTSLPGGSTTSIQAVCTGDDVATGGGGYTTNNNAAVTVEQGQPITTGGTPDGWQALFNNSGVAGSTAVAFVICAD